MSKLIAALIQLGISQLLTFEQDSGCAGRPLGLLFEKLVHA